MGGFEDSHFFDGKRFLQGHSGPTIVGERWERLLIGTSFFVDIFSVKK